ncbi:uncharacterized protein [Palaemon carinicauda]|uniref:uncharacterized protein n=1 Tax=Palaemon carinicauda TaxID=392227 RepID=UPI0035B5EF5C
MISSIKVSQQTFGQAKQTLIAAFADEMPQKFVLIKELTDLRFVWGKDDPYIFYAHIKKLIDAVKDNAIDLDTVMLYFVRSSLPTKFQDIIVAITNKSHPTLVEVTGKFLEACSRYNAQLNISKESPCKTAVLATSLNTSLTRSLCMLCNAKDHKIASCTKYLQVSDKIKRLKELHKCFKCLKAAHNSNECRFQTSGVCFKCKKGKHWSFLCSSKPTDSSNSKQTTTKVVNVVESVNEIPSTVTASSHLDIVDSLLPLLTVTTEYDRVKVDTVLDSGSQNSFIEESLADFLNLKVVDPKIHLIIKGINTNQKICTKSVSFPFKIGDVSYEITCICIPKIKIQMKAPHMYKLIELLRQNGKEVAYDKFNGVNRIHDIDDIKLLIGAKDWHCVMSMESGVLGQKDRLTSFYRINDKLILIGSISDWIKNLSDAVDTSLMSHRKISEETKSTTSYIGTMEIDSDGFDYEVPTLDGIYNFESLPDIAEVADYSQLGHDCKIFINMEEEDSIECVTNETEQEVTDFILCNIYRDSEKFYVVPIPWLTRYKDLLGSNERLAFKVMCSLKKKYMNSNVLKRIDEVFQSQIDLGIIEKVEDFEEYKRKFPKYFFISHSPVIKEERDTTKVRVIYMANLAEKRHDGSKGISLNQCIHPGYNKNFKISDALTMMRFDKFILGFDISKAFHRLAIDDENSSKFLFYWFKDVESRDFTPVVYRSKRVIFGMSVSPYLLQCCLYKMLILETDGDTEEIQELKKRIFQGSYVDNFLIGCADEDEVEMVHREASTIFEQHKFPLQQYVTNYSQFQRDIDCKVGTETPQEVKILGMCWDRYNDILKATCVKLNVEANTLRQILSSVMSIFDLNNTNLPVLNRCKIFLRQLQSDYVDKWDTSLHGAQLNEWRNIASQFNNGERLEIPKYMGSRKSNFDIIVMSDASKNFLGCVIYLQERNSKLVSFVSAHNKILNKNLKGRTMPVLELTAVEYALQRAFDLYKMLTSCIVPIAVNDIMLFSDSTIALSWLADYENLRTKLQKRSVYVNNRIANIVDLCKSTHSVKLAHVGSNENAADFTTRLVSFSKLRNSCYLTGPKMLREDLNLLEWLVIPNPGMINDVDIPKLVVNKASVEDMSVGTVVDLTKYSSLDKAIKVLMKVKLFINKLRLRINSKSQQSIALLDASYKKCSNDLLKLDQQNCFPDLQDFFTSKRKAKKCIPELVSRMNVFCDTDGILRVKCKMGKMSKGMMSRTPILISNNSDFGRILIMDTRVKFNHSGTYYVLHKLKPAFFLLKGFSTVKKVVNECYHCKRFNSRPVKVNANDYREWNVNPIKRFFSVCFIDYFGPYSTRYGSDKVKTYGVIFKCIWSHMINVEIVTSGDSKGFLLAFQNHVYNYGLPNKVFSDSGSNLGGAFTWIEECLKASEVQEFFNQRGVDVTEFSQYPRGSLNRGIGGIIESGVGLVRKLIQGAIHNNILDFLEFSHVIKQCICYANKKPISELGALREQNVNDDFQVLSPEFLKFGYDTQVMECIYHKGQLDDYDSSDLGKDFRRLIHIKEKLRNSYHNEFLFGLQDQATKYRGKYYPREHVKISKGDIVLIKDSMVKAPNYPLARVLDVIYNSLSEAVQVQLVKGNKSVVFRDI